MAAYAAVISLKNTIDGIIECSRFSVDPSCVEIIQLAYEKLQPLKELLERLDSTRKNRNRTRINALDERIKEEVWRFEDLLESHVTDEILSQSETHRVVFSIDMEWLRYEVYYFVEDIECMEKDYMDELYYLPEEEAEEEERIGFGGKKSKMVGLSHQFQDVKNFLMKEQRKEQRRNRVYGLLGMAGIGKTTLAEEIFEDPQIQSHFEHRVWVTVGRKSRSSEYYARAVLSQLDPYYDGEDEEEICKHLKETLEDKRCLIVLDDVWELQVLASVLDSLPESGTTQILLTARDRNVTADLMLYLNPGVMRFMNEDESTNLLCMKVFGEEGSLPSKLEKAAKKIAKKCEGLPLLIVAVADRLSEGDMTEEYWNEVAEERNSVFKDALEKISEVLFPSYDYLPQYLKMFFLYLGVFHPDCEITPSNLVNMLSGEGWFLDTTKQKPLRKLVSDGLFELCSWSYLVLFNQSSRRWFMISGQYIFKNCRLHCSWRHLCQREAWKNKFYRVLNGCVDGSEEFIKGQRCLCLHNNILFAIEDVRDSVQLNCASSARSLLCFGPYHQYPIPIDVDFKLLRELDALNLRFYTFPTEILKLVQLKYLALTCNGEIPSTIFQTVQPSSLDCPPTYEH